MADHRNFLVSIAFADLTNKSREVIHAKLGPVHGPELLICGRVFVVHLRILNTRIVCKVYIKTHLAKLFSHGIAFVKLHEPA